MHLKFKLLLPLSIFHASSTSSTLALRSHRCRCLPSLLHVMGFLITVLLLLVCLVSEVFIVGVGSTLGESYHQWLLMVMGENYETGENHGTMGENERIVVRQWCQDPFLHVVHYELFGGTINHSQQIERTLKLCAKVEETRQLNQLHVVPQVCVLKGQDMRALIS